MSVHITFTFGLDHGKTGPCIQMGFVAFFTFKGLRCLVESSKTFFSSVVNLSKKIGCLTVVRNTLNFGCAKAICSAYSPYSLTMK